MMAKEKEQVFIKGPSGDRVQIAKSDFEKSHYAEQGYEIDGPVPEIDPEEPKDVPLEVPA